MIDGFIADFYCHVAGLVVEVDGEIHEENVHYDVERDRILMSRGLRMLRVKNREIQENLPDVLNRIALCAANENLTP